MTECKTNVYEETSRYRTPSTQEFCGVWVWVCVCAHMCGDAQVDCILIVSLLNNELALHFGNLTVA